jgi:hypothetical protein
VKSAEKRIAPMHTTVFILTLTLTLIGRNMTTTAHQERATTTVHFWRAIFVL